MVQEISDYKDAIRFLYGLQKYGIKFGLSKTSNLLAGIGNPHKGQNYIHIAGTNGKGSTASFVASVLKEAGLKVGLYTSPHLVRFTERFKINDKEISQDQVVSIVNRLKKHIVEAEPPTFFEATTAMALAYFADQGVDLAIMEVGMGGRLDATNVINPIVSVISNIGMEHQFFLGKTLLKIAREKAGIIKQGVPLITGVTQGPVIKLIKGICKERGARVIRLGEDVKYRTNGGRLFFYGQNLRLKGLELGLLGKFQYRNAALALSVVEEINKWGFEISETNIRQGLKKARWPGRMEVISRNPTVLVDGAHNPAAMKALVNSIEGLAYEHLIVVIGVMEDKEIGKIIRQIVPEADHVIYTRPRYPRAAPPQVLWEKGKGVHRSGEVIPFIDQALDKAISMASGSDIVLVCGSLFTVGEAMNHIDPIRYWVDEI